MEDNIIGVRKRKRDTPTRRRSTAIDKIHQQELMDIEDEGTELLAIRGDLLSYLIVLMTMWAAFLQFCYHHLNPMCFGCHAA